MALAAGDEAPATVEELDGGSSGTGGKGDEAEHGQQGGQQPLLRRGSPVAFRPGARADFRHRSALAADSPELLRLCGDLRCFRVVEAPLRAFLHKTVAAVEDQPLSPSLFAKDMAVVESVSLVAMLVMIAALILLGKYVHVQMKPTKPASKPMIDSNTPPLHHTYTTHSRAAVHVAGPRVAPRRVGGLHLHGARAPGPPRPAGLAPAAAAPGRGAGHGPPPRRPGSPRARHGPGPERGPRAAAGARRGAAPEPALRGPARVAPAVSAVHGRGAAGTPVWGPGTRCRWRRREVAGVSCCCPWCCPYLARRTAAAAACGAGDGRHGVASRRGAGPGARTGALDRARARKRTTVAGNTKRAGAAAHHPHEPERGAAAPRRGDGSVGRERRAGVPRRAHPGGGALSQRAEGKRQKPGPEQGRRGRLGNRPPPRARRLRPQQTQV